MPAKYCDKLIKFAKSNLFIVSIVFACMKKEEHGLEKIISDENQERWILLKAVELD